MKYSFISDIHIKSADDNGAEILKSFFNHPLTEESDRIILMGDIFDFMVGDHKKYINEYSFFFEAILKFINHKKEVIFIEGNHDFHFSKIIQEYLEQNSQNSSHFRYLKAGEDIILGEEKYHYCHGYEVDYENKYFKRWYRIYSSHWFYYIITYIIPYTLIKWLGGQASKDSKRRGKKTFNFDQMKAKYLKGAKSFIRERNIKGVISGHTHIKEFHTYQDGTVYINIGFPRRDKEFIHYNGKKFEAIKIAQENSSL